MKSRKLFFGLVALVGFGSFVMLNAFKSTQKTLPQYQYMSNINSTTELRKISNWEEVDSSTPNCGSAGSLVCRYQFDGDIAAFESFISTKDADYINDNAFSYKQ